MGDTQPETAREALELAEGTCFAAYPGALPPMALLPIAAQGGHKWFQAADLAEDALRRLRGAIGPEKYA